MAADFDWDEVSDWPREDVMRWWKQGWDWESLKTKECPHPAYPTYADYYRPTGTEAVYWGARWITPFAGKTWDIYHLPTFDPETGDPSPKHDDYKGDDKWSDDDHQAFARGLIARMCAGWRFAHNDDQRAPLSGIVTPRRADLRPPPDTTLFVVFSAALFGDGADLSGAAFGNRANLSGACFGNRANLSGARFERSVNLSGAAFGRFANLSGARFGDFADLSGAAFGRFANLSGAAFGDEAKFIAARFLGEVNFSLGASPQDGQRSGRIAPDANASDTRSEVTPAFTIQMDKQQDWAAERAFRNISFAGAAFRGDADFSNRRFAGSTDFSRAVFDGVPIFHGASLHENTIFTLAESFFPAPGRTAVYGDWTARCKAFEQAYRRLKLLMQAQGAKAEEQFFYTLEIKSRIQRRDRANVSAAEIFFAQLYGHVADYGQSVSKPLIWIGYIGLFVGYIFLLLSRYAFQPGTLWESFVQTVGYEFLYFMRSLLPGLSIHDITRHGSGDGYDRWLAAMQTDGFQFAFMPIAIVHSILNLVLTFLFALAIRRRFQIS